MSDSNESVSAAAAVLGSLGGHISWGNTSDRTQRTAPGRAAFEQKFLDEAEGDPARAANLRKAYYRRLALKSAAARRRTAAAKSTQSDGAA